MTPDDRLALRQAGRGAQRSEQLAHGVAAVGAVGPGINSRPLTLLAEHGGFRLDSVDGRAPADLDAAGAGESGYRLASADPCDPLGFASQIPPLASEYPTTACGSALGAHPRNYSACVTGSEARTARR